MTGFTSSTPPNKPSEHTYSPTSSARDQPANPHAFGRRDNGDAASTPQNADAVHAGQAASSSSAFTQSDHARPAFMTEPGPVDLQEKRKMSRYAFMLIIFAVGTAVGLGASWAFRHSGGPSQPLVVKSVSPSLPAQVAVPQDANRAVTVRGISPSELPYDGKPPAVEEGEPDAELATAAPRQDVLPEARLSETPPPLPVERSSGSSVDEAPEVQEQVRKPSSEMPAKSAAEADIARTKKQEAAEPVKPVKQQPSPKETQRLQQKSNEREEGSAKAASKKRAPAKLAKDREIDRIKQEADKELQRKLEVGRANEEARARRQLAASRYSDQRVDAKTAHVRKVLATCERIPNLFRREKCKWDLCGNRWGKHGCPSYTRPVTTY